jgi:hypothetical protein
VFVSKEVFRYKTGSTVQCPMKSKKLAKSLAKGLSESTLKMIDSVIDVDSLHIRSTGAVPVNGADNE